MKNLLPKKTLLFQKIIRELYDREREYKKTVFKAQDSQEDAAADQIVYESMYYAYSTEACQASNISQVTVSVGLHCTLLA